MRRLAICLLALAVTVIAEKARAEMVDAFGGDLSAYAKSVVLTNSTNDEATCLSMTSFNILADALVLSTSVTDGKAYQTVLLRDDYSLAVGKRLQVKVSGIPDTGSAEFGLCVARQKSYPFKTREDFLTMGIVDQPSSGLLKSRMFRGSTELKYGYDAPGSINNLTGYYIDRVDTNLYVVGCMTTTGDLDVAVRYHTGGAAAIGFFSDSRETVASLATVDDLEIVNSSGCDLIAADVIYNVSATEGTTNVPENTLNAHAVPFIENLPSAKTAENTFWVGLDDDAVQTGVSGHIVYDMGSSMAITEMHVWSRDTTSSVLPKAVKVFGFADNDPTHIQGPIDDIENDPNIVELYSGDLANLKSGLGQTVELTSAYMGRYIGIRVDSSYTTGKFQIGEVRFTAVPEPAMLAAMLGGLLLLAVRRRFDR